MRPANLLPLSPMQSLLYAAARALVFAIQRLPLRPLARAFYAASNLAGRLLERLAAAGPLASFIGYLDRRLPMNGLVVAERER